MRYPETMKKYIGDLTRKPLVPLLRDSANDLSALLGNLPPEKWKVRYAPGKWSVAALVGHLVDSERIFPYRALRIARRDPGILPSFDENVFAEHSNAEHRDGALLLADFAAARASAVQMFASFTSEMMGLEGDVSDYRISVDGIGYQLAGHYLHHLSVLRERYGL